MELSKAFGVERNTDFRVAGYESVFQIKLDNGVTETLFRKRPADLSWQSVHINVLYDVISGAPDNIIRLPPPLSNEQHEQLKALWTLGYKWLAKDKYGSVYAYEVKPYEKSRDTWLCHGDLYLCYTKPTKYLEPLVSWSDHEPYDIGKALGVGE